MKLNRKWILVIALLLSVAAATAGTLAYLTDRDSEVNTFTVGNVEIELNEEFEQGAELIPGVDITKKATITNTGKNNAWVWLTVLLPEEMGPHTAPDNMSASNNVVHWNYPSESAANIIVDFNATPVEIDTDEDGVKEKYYQTNMLWKEILEPGETTGVMMSKVYMDTHVDIDPDGNMYWVENGVAKDLNWNVNENGNPKIIVSAYAIQTEGFDTVEEAYAAYTKQWGDNGAEYGDNGGAEAEPTLPTTSWLDENNYDTSWYDASATSYTISNAKELAGLSKLVYDGNTFAGKTIELDADIDLGDHMWTPIGRMINTSGTGEESTFKGTFDGKNHTVSNLYIDTVDGIEGNDSDKGAGLFGAVRTTISNVTVDTAVIKTAHWAGAIAGSVEVGGVVNCHAKNITIECLPELIGSGYDNGDKAGGISGYISEGADVENCTVTNATITGYRDIGGVVGYANSGVKNCTISNVTLTLDNTNNYKNYAANDDYDFGNIVGEVGTGSVVECEGTAVISYGN